MYKNYQKIKVFCDFFYKLLIFFYLCDIIHAWGCHGFDRHMEIVSKHIAGHTASKIATKYKCKPKNGLRCCLIIAHVAFGFVSRKIKSII